MINQEEDKERTLGRPKESDKSEGPHDAGLLHEYMNRVTIQVLERIRRGMPTNDLLRDVVVPLADWTGFEAVEIRLKEGEDYPYFQTTAVMPLAA
jgi:hypothetical protein